MSGCFLTIAGILGLAVAVIILHIKVRRLTAIITLASQVPRAAARGIGAPTVTPTFDPLAIDLTQRLYVAIVVTLLIITLIKGL